jgi:hypothetical protein
MIEWHKVISARIFTRGGPWYIYGREGAMNFEDFSI